MSQHKMETGQSVEIARALGAVTRLAEEITQLQTYVAVHEPALLNAKMKLADKWAELFAARDQAEDTLETL